MLLGHSKGNKDVSSGLGSVIVVKPRVVAARLRIEGVVVLKLQLAIPSAISAVLIVASPVGVISFTKIVLIVLSIEISDVYGSFPLATPLSRRCAFGEIIGFVSYISTT